MKQPQISIIVPVYNVERYLERCLESIINQTFRDIEIICVDDGSTDNSLNILKEFAEKDSRIINIINKHNRGPSFSRNAGLNIARGKYIGLVDSDDYIELNFYETMYNHFENNSGIDIVCCGTNIVGDAFLDIRDVEEEYHRIKYDGKVNLTDEIRRSINVDNCNKLYKKSIIDNFDLRFLLNRHYEDNSFYWSYIINVENAYFEKEKFYNYTRRPDSIMGQSFNRKSKKTVDYLYVAKGIFDFWTKHNFLEKHKETFAYIFEHCFRLSYDFSPIRIRKNVFYTATKLVNEMGLDSLCPENSFIIFLKQKKYKMIDPEFYTPLEELLSIRNANNHLILSLLGVKIKLRNKFQIKT